MNTPFQQFGGMPQQNGMQALIQSINRFRQSFSGDARQQIQQMLNSGKVTQQQYNSAVQQAQQFMDMLNGGCR